MRWAWIIGGSVALAIGGYFAFKSAAPACVAKGTWIGTASYTDGSGRLWVLDPLTKGPTGSSSSYTTLGSRRFRLNSVPGGLDFEAVQNLLGCGMDESP